MNTAQVVDVPAATAQLTIGVRQALTGGKGP
jgi:hypothetical protein